MTVIAWDGKMLAADKRAVCSGNSRTVTKLRRIGSLLVGAAGPSALGYELMMWLENGAKPDEFPADQRNDDKRCTLLVIDGGKVLVYESSPYPIEFEDKQFAIGCGRDFALAAMHCGLSAFEAVLVASHFDAGCGNGVDVLSPDN